MDCPIQSCACWPRDVSACTCESVCSHQHCFIGPDRSSGHSAGPAKENNLMRSCGVETRLERGPKKVGALPEDKCY